MKYLIVGIGNIGQEYDRTRHNIGFMILDALAGASNVVFGTERYGDVANMRVKNCELLLLKPSTYVNLSGTAVRYWLQKEKIDIDHMLVVVDDLALPLGTLRLRGSGSAGGHNGLKNIEALIGTQKYARLRFGIGSDYKRGSQIDYVLSRFDEKDEMLIENQISIACEEIKSFCLQGLVKTMNIFNA